MTPSTKTFTNLTIALVIFAVIYTESANVGSPIGNKDGELSQPNPTPTPSPESLEIGNKCLRLAETGAKSPPCNQSLLKNMEIQLALNARCHLYFDVEFVNNVYILLIKPNNSAQNS